MTPRKRKSDSSKSMVHHRLRSFSDSGSKAFDGETSKTNRVVLWQLKTPPIPFEQEGASIFREVT